MSDTVRVTFERQSRAKVLAAMVACFVALQLICAMLFLLDVVSEYPGIHHLDWHFMRETLATVGVFVGIALQVGWLRGLIRRNSRLERSVSMASSALQTIVEAHFAEWKLTPSEREIGFLLVKGLSISEIASVRGTAEGTVKAHLNAIYRKSHSRNRAELMSTLMDTLVERPLITARTAQD